jgi:NADPH:quinone reductase-like Zn-dependent oxidoreductase
LAIFLQSAEEFRFKVGDKVFGQSRKHKLAGGLQQYPTLDEDHAFFAPELRGVSADQLATLPVNSVQAFMTLLDDSGFGYPRPFPDDPSFQALNFLSQSLVINFPISGYVRIVLQFAKFAGFGSIIIFSSSPNMARDLENWGATLVIPSLSIAHRETLAELVRDIANQELTALIKLANLDIIFSARLLSYYEQGRVVTNSLRNYDFNAGNRKYPPIIVRQNDINEISGDVGTIFWKHLKEWVDKVRFAP